MDNENIPSDTSSVSVFYFSEILAGERKNRECFLLSMNETLYEIIDFYPPSV